MKHAKPTLVALALCGAALLASPVRAENCGVLSPTTGNVVGSLAGAAAGGLLGNQFGHGKGQGLMTGAGVVGGALAGGYVGRRVEGCGRTQAAAPAASGGAARQAPTAASADGRTCRYVATQAVIDGREQPVNGVACLQPDGSWRVASDPGAQRAADADLVLRAQSSLRDQGFYVQNNIDGRWGPATSNAVRNFQRTKGLAVSGQLDGPTQAALGLETPPLVAGAAATPAAVPSAQPVSAPGTSARQ